jgi:hypothetical protein
LLLTLPNTWDLLGEYVKHSIFIGKTLTQILKDTPNISGTINSLSIIGSVFLQSLSQHKGLSREETLVNLSRAFPDMPTPQLVFLVDNI